MLLKRTKFCKERVMQAMYESQDTNKVKGMPKLQRDNYKNRFIQMYDIMDINGTIMDHRD